MARLLQHDVITVASGVNMVFQRLENIFSTNEGPGRKNENHCIRAHWMSYALEPCNIKNERFST